MIRSALSSTFLVLTVFLDSCNSSSSPPNPAPTGILEGIGSGTTIVVDLTHRLNSRNPYWPGKGNKPFKFEYFTSLQKDRVLEGHFTVDEHTGTHIDAPNHFVAWQLSLDKCPVERFFVPVVVIDVRSRVAKDPDYLLSTADIDQWESQHGRVPPNAMVTMYTGWEERWDDFAKYKNADKAGILHFPGFSLAAARHLVLERQAAGLGIDALSIDTGKSEDFPAHLVSHAEGKYNLENLANMGKLPAVGATIIVAPIKIEGGTGTPVRLYALTPAAKK